MYILQPCYKDFMISLSSCSDISDIYIIVQLCLSIMQRKINISSFKFIRSQVIHEKLGYFAVQRVNWQLRWNSFYAFKSNALIPHSYANVIQCNDLLQAMIRFSLVTHFSTTPHPYIFSYSYSSYFGITYICTISITCFDQYSFFYQSDGLIWHSLDMFRNYVLYELCIVCGYLRSSPSNLYFVIGTLLIITLNRYTNWQEKILMTWRWSFRMQIKCIS